MNKIFKVIYSKVRNCYVVTSEFAKANTKSSTGSAKQTAKKSLLSLAIAMGIAGGGFVNVGAFDNRVTVETTSGSTAIVYTKDGTESFVHTEVEAKLDHELKYYYTASQVDGKLEALSTGATTNKDNITTLDSKTAGLSADGKSLSGMTTVSGTNVETGALTVTGEIKNGAGVTTTLADINDSMKKTTRIDYDAANDTTSVNGMKVGQQVDMGGKNLTDVGTINGIALGEKESGDFISQDGSIWGNMKNVDAQVGKNLVAIGENTEAITNLDTKVGTVGTGTYLDPTKSIGENLGRLDAGLNQEVADRTAADNDLSDRIGTVTDDGNYIKKSATNNVSENLKVLDGELAKTNDRTGGITRNADDTKTTIEGKVTVDKDGNVGGVKDLTVDGKLNVGEIYLENNKLDSPSGKKHDSATAITADGISNLAKVTDHGHTTESQFTHNEKGTINYAKDGDTTDWTETRSDVTAKGVTTKVKDSKQNRTNTSQTADGIKGYATDKDGNKTYTKVTATENSFQIQDKDGKNKNHQVNTKDSSVTEITNEDGKTTKTEQTATDITNTAKDGTITNDAQTIVNNTTGDMTNTVGGKLTTTVTGQATENFNGGLDTNVTGTENHIVTGAQNIHVTGNQTNEVGGNQTTTVAGDISNSAKNIVNTADERITNNAKVINNKASEVINNEAVNINNKASGIISSSASEIKNQADKLISNKVGENTYQNIENGKITESIKDGIKQNLTQSDADKTEHSVVNGENATVNKQTSEELTGAVTNGSSSNVIQNTATSSNNTIADLDAAGKPTKANSVISTVDGTTFSNTEANTVLTAKKDLGKDFTNTTIKGNTITTGQATMDYADVMKDLGVRGNANIQGKTTTGSLEVTGTSTLKGDVTMESNATVKKDLTVEGTTTTKDLHVTNNATVGGNATITGDVTANSYKVGNNTYIDANGINANNQKVTYVADGTIAEGSMDAVNGGQLFETNRRIDQFDSRINEVGANAAAMANLHPMEFDADSKLNVAVGVGNYRNKTATAMGLFYRPNEDVMFNVSSTIGSNDNMVGGGISFRLGSGGNKEKAKALAQATEHNKQLKSQVDMLQAQMDALLSVINPNMSKDFPDVPDNHWAYEAVSRLAGNDIIQGYEDGKYHGERTMTRYEMAVIIYKALQKGTKAEAKLVEEFKPELKAIAAHEKA